MLSVAAHVPRTRLLSEVIDKGPRKFPSPALSQQRTQDGSGRGPTEAAEPGHWDFGPVMPEQETKGQMGQDKEAGGGSGQGRLEEAR